MQTGQAGQKRQLRGKNRTIWVHGKTRHQVPVAGYAIKRWTPAPLTYICTPAIQKVGKLVTPVQMAEGAGNTPAHTPKVTSPYPIWAILKRDVMVTPTAFAWASMR